MPRKGANISLSSYDDIFETDESRADSQLEAYELIYRRKELPPKLGGSWKRPILLVRTLVIVAIRFAGISVSPT